MEQFFEKLTQVNDAVNSFVWVKIGLFLLIGAGIIMTVSTRFFQVTHLGHWWKMTIGSIFGKGGARKKTDKKSISQFQALCTALAATIGTGNIAGVSAAIVIGGPGAVFWMWVAAFLGMMTNYSENVLGIYYRRRNQNGEWSGGAMYYLADGLGSKKGMKGISKVLAHRSASATWVRSTRSRSICSPRLSVIPKCSVRSAAFPSSTSSSALR